MITIQILIYTDSEDIFVGGEPGGFRVNILKKLLEAKRMGFVEFHLTVINRFEAFFQPQHNNEPRVLRKLTRELLEKFDEIWFFGMYQKDVDQDFDKLNGGRENELADEEVEELRRWMTRGGVLMAGDHSVKRPEGKDTDLHDTFLCLGRALGRRVTRAGALRKWEGEPTLLPIDSFNTLVSPVGLQNPEDDSLPQTLSLTLKNGTPHRLFLGERLTIDVFPDHGHEGQLLIPSELDINWPPFDEKDSRNKPKPEVVAEGSDSQHGAKRPVLIVYDGDDLGVGRIVSDSSWHHYLDVNLQVLPDNGVDSILDLLGQLFQNIALYLTPRCERQQISEDMVEWMVKHSAVQEERGNDPAILGKVGLQYLSEITTRFEREELFQLTLATQKTEGHDLSFSSLKADSLLPSQEEVVGSIITLFHDIASERLAPDGNKKLAPKAMDVIATGFAQALGSHCERLRDVLLESRLTIVDGKTPTLKQEQAENLK